MKFVGKSENSYEKEMYFVDFELYRFLLDTFDGITMEGTIAAAIEAWNTSK